MGKSNDPRSDRERFEALLAALLDGDASADTVEALLGLLDQSPGMQDSWRKAVATHADLGFLLNPPRPFSAEELRLISSKRSQASSDHEFAEEGPTARSGSSISSRRLWPLLLATAATVLFVFSWREATRPATPQETAVKPDVIAVITRTVGSDLDLTALRSEEIVAGDFFEFSQGLVELRIDDGITVVAMGPARFRVLSAAEIKLDFGRLTATVDEGFEGFRLTTAEGVFTDLGTSFSVDAEMNAASTLNVHSGEVQVHATATPENSRRFVEGEGVRLSPAASQQPFVEFDAAGIDPLDSLFRPHARIACTEDTYVVSGGKSEVICGDRKQIWVKLDLMDPLFCRRGLVGFDLSDFPLNQLVGARLVLTVDPNDYADRIEPTNKASTCDWVFRVSGVWDDDQPPWSEAKTNWTNAPGNDRIDSLGRPLGPRGESHLGKFVVAGRGERGQSIAIETPELLGYLRNDSDGWITLSINRQSGFTWSVESEDRVIHSFASSEHPSLPGPTLELWFDGTQAAPGQ